MSERWTRKTMDRDDDRDYLDVILEEKFGGVRTPPDLRHRVLATTPEQRRAAMRAIDASSWRPTRAGWVAAAVLLLGLSATLAVLFFSQKTDATKGDPTPKPIQDKHKKQDGVLVHPKTKAEFLKHLPDVTSISIGVITTTRHSHNLHGESKLDIVDKKQVSKLTGLIAKGLKPALPAGWKWPNTIDLHMLGGRYIRCSMYMLGRSPLLGISGIGNWAMSQELSDTLRPLILQAEEIARIREGVVFTRNDLLRRGKGAVPAGVYSLTCYALMDDDLSLLSRFTSLHHLNLIGCSKTLDGSGMKHVAKLVTLGEINLKNTAIDDDALARLGALPALRRLDLRYAAKIEGIGFRGFAKSKSLRELDLTYCPQLTDDGLSAVAKIPSLGTLNLSGLRLGKVTTEGLARLGKAKSLHDLDLSDWPLDLDQAMGGFGMLRTLRTLDLSDTSISADGFAAFQFIHGPDVPAAQYPLKSLDLSGCKAIDDKALEVVSTYSNLEWLVLSRCQKVTVDGLRQLTKLQRLTYLDLDGIKLTAEACKLVAALPNVEFLDLGDTGTDDEGIDYLKNMRSLHKLVLSNCDAITDVGLGKLSVMGTLRDLDLRYCDGISESAAEKLQAALPDCSVRWR